jgi:hypothetical protein
LSFSVLSVSYKKDIAIKKPPKVPSEVFLFKALMNRKTVIRV